MGMVLPDFVSPVGETLPFPSSALPASGFVGIISARVLKAPLTGRKDGEGFLKQKDILRCRLKNSTAMTHFLFLSWLLVKPRRTFSQRDGYILHEFIVKLWKLLEQT